MTQVCPSSHQLREKLQLFVTTDRNKCTQVINEQRKQSRHAWEEEEKGKEELSGEEDGWEAQSSQTWSNHREDYQLQEVIWSGAAAVVQAAYCIPRRERVAIKRTNLKDQPASMLENLRAFQALGCFQHPNIVSGYTWFVAQQEVWQVMKLLAGGSMLDLISHLSSPGKHKSGVQDEVAIATVLKAVLEGLEYLHRNGQIHRNIKAENILLGEDGSVQLAGWSSSVAMGTLVGTPGWMAPEVIEQVQGYDSKVDIWSFGITAIELATGAAPHHNLRPLEVPRLTLQNDPPGLETGITDKETVKRYSKSFRKMIGWCLQKEPHRRPTASELLKHKFFQKAKTAEYLMEKLLPPAPAATERTRPEPRGHEEPDEEAEQGKVAALSSPQVKEGPESSQVFQVYQNPDLLCAQPQPVAGPADPAPLESWSASAQGLLQAPSPTPAAPGDSKAPIHLELRLRTSIKEVTNIRFEFMPGTDTAAGMSQELVAAGLVDGKDQDIVASNLQKIIDEPQDNKNTTFKLASSTERSEILGTVKVMGCAKFSYLGQ